MKAWVAKLRPTWVAKLRPAGRIRPAKCFAHFPSCASFPTADRSAIRLVAACHVNRTVSGPAVARQSRIRSSGQNVWPLLRQVCATASCNATNKRADADINLTRFIRNVRLRCNAWNNFVPVSQQGLRSTKDTRLAFVGLCSSQSVGLLCLKAF